VLSEFARSRSTRRQAEKVCRARIAELDLPVPFRWGSLVDRVEQRRGRELWVKDSSVLPPEITGLWVGCASRDYVFYRADLDDCRRETTIMHEFSHIICEHRSAHVANEAWLAEHCPWVAKMGDVEHVCLRAAYATADEQEAELMATLILARAAGRGRESGAGSAAEELAARHRVESIWQS
jgi:hypothetical protein